MQAYTGSAKIDIVTHSLGDTLARRLMALFPQLATDVVAFVGIAGANHGTTVCRGLDTSYYGRTFPGAYHNDLRVGPAEVDTYLPFLLRYGHAGPGAATDGAAQAAQIETDQPDGLYGALCGVTALTGPVAGCLP